jgi:hypothetical protein
MPTSLYSYKTIKTSKTTKLGISKFRKGCLGRGLYSAKLILDYCFSIWVNPSFQSNSSIIYPLIIFCNKAFKGPK